MNKIMRMAFVLLVIFIMTFGEASAQNKNAVWTIEIIGANGLLNADFGIKNLSDPFVEIFIWSSRGIIHEQTPVIANSLNPQWNYKITREFPAGEKIQRMLFVVWDHGKSKNHPLGLATIDRIYPGREQVLALHRKLGKENKFWETFLKVMSFGTRHPPGTLKVMVNVKYPLVKVPDLKNKTDVEAKNLLKSAGLIAISGKVLVKNKELLGKVLIQTPGAGTEAPLGQVVFYYIGNAPTYTMPKVTGKRIDDAIRALLHFKNIHIDYQVPKVNMARDAWMKVQEQSPQAGEKNMLADNAIRLTVARPAADFKLTVPGVTGETPQDAYKALYEANLPRIIFKKQKISEEDKNNRVVSQKPAGGEQISWKDGRPIVITIGWYADGHSLYAAKLTNFDEPFSETFKKPRSSVYRSLKITEPGYIVLKKSQGPGNLNPLAVYYRNSGDAGWQQVNERRDYLPSAQRVTPGEWVVRIEPEMAGSVSAEPCQFECSFIPEFDTAEPNNNFEQAVGIAPNAEITAGFIGSYDKDFYSFEVEKPGYLEVLSEKLPTESTDGNGLDISYALYNEKEESIGSYYFPSAVYLPPGKYYIDFEAGGDSWSLMRYKLTMRFHPAADVGEPNDTKETAYTVKAGDTIPVAYSVNDEDFYLIKSDEPGYAILSHDASIPFDIDFYRYDSKGETTGPVLYLPAAVKVNKERLVSLKAVSEGHGYLVDPPVNLQIGFISAKQDVFEPNDTLKQAAPIKLNQEVAGLLMPRYEKDTYSFNVPKSEKIYFDFIKPEGTDISVKGRLLSADGKVVADRLYLPAEVMIDKPGRYILQFGQEPGLQKLCEKQYKLTIRDGQAEASSDNRVPSDRYGKKGDAGCLDLAKQAYQLLSDEKYQKAKELYQQALQCRPDHEVIWNDYAVTCYKLNENEAAENALNKAIGLNKDYALAYRNLALVHWEKGENNKGAELASKAAALDASDENLRYAAHGYILLSDKQNMPDKKQSLEKAAKYYRMMKNIPEASKESLKTIEQFLQQH